MDIDDRVYRRLAKALDGLPNGFPPTESGIEIEILKWMFTPEQAEIAGLLDAMPASQEEIAARLESDRATSADVATSADAVAGADAVVGADAVAGADAVVGTDAVAGAGPAVAATLDLSRKLREMRKRGLIWPIPTDGGSFAYRLAPFVVGIYEAQVETMDHRLAHLVDEYFNQGGLAGMMRLQPSVHRVVPAHGSVKSEWVLPYDDVRSLLLQAKSFRVIDCICRKQQSLVGKGCDKPIRMCLSFSPASSPTGSPAGPYSISQEEALAVLDRAEEVGLVHTVSNVAKGVNYVCNCCGCCCGILRGITQFGVADSVAHANYLAKVDAAACTGCGTCTTRCQVGAITLNGDGVAVVDVERCIGCGLCASGCPDGAATLEFKPADQIVEPPADFGAWQKERVRRRGGGRE